MNTRRASAAILVDGLFSISSLVLSISIARSATVEEFGSFAFAMTIYLFANGIIRATVTETTLSLTPDHSVLRDGFQRVVFVSLAGAGLLVAVATTLGLPFLQVLGICLPGIVALDYVRLTNALLNSARTAVILGLIWAGSVLALGLTVLLIPAPAITVFSLWAASGAILGVIAAIRCHLSWAPRWRRDLAGTRNAIWFGADYLAGSGGSLLTTTLLGGIFGPTILAALRGAGTLLGPANLLSTTTRSFCLPYLTRARVHGPNHELRRAAVVAVLAMLAVTPLLILIVFLPPEIGTALLGQSWTLAAQVLLPLSLESLLSLGGSVAAAGHRSRMVGSHSFFLRLSTAVARPIVVLLSAAQSGPQGAAWAMAGLAMLNLLIWWTSYFVLCRKAS